MKYSKKGKIKEICNMILNENDIVNSILEFINKLYVYVQQKKENILFLNEIKRKLCI